MERLTQLHLAESNITQIHPSIECLTGLTFLNLSSCARLLSLPTEIGNLRSLKILILRYCIKLDQIPPSLANAQSLEILHISGTSISHVPSSMHCLKNLETLECKWLSCGIWKSLLPQFNNHPISSGLSCIKILNLSCCRLVDEDVPEDLHCFSSLEILHLSYNHFSKLPDSLCHLKKLKALYLNYCTELKDLPKLPTSLERVEGVGCISISEKFYNKRLHILSDLKENLHLDFSIPSKTTKVECPINELQHMIFDRRTWEGSISKEKRCTYKYSKVDILECFDQINKGNWINIEYNQEFSFNNDISNVCGVFFSANIEYQQTLDHFEVILGNLLVEFEIDGNPLNLRLLFREKFQSQRSIWVAYLPIKFLKDELMLFQSCCSMKTTISCDNIYVNVKACGASILSWQNASEYLTKFFTKIYCSKRIFNRMIKDRNHESECKCDELGVAKDDFPAFAFESTGTDWTFLRWKSLTSTLWSMFEEAKDLQVNFFPLKKVSRWFRNQNKNNKVAIKLPLNIRKEKKWMGLAAFVIFSISENAKCYCFSYETKHLDERRLTFKSEIPIKLLEYSNRILFIVFEPRDWYPYEQNSTSNHVYISFDTKVERMQVESCGARLVYKQNVKGLIQTIVDCIVESGDDFYEYYNQMMMAGLLGMIDSHNHKVSSLQNVPTNKPTIATTALTDIDSSLSVEQLLHGSFPHPLLQKNIKERFGSKFDLILHGDKIPEFFNNQSIGNMTSLKLPVYQHPREVGLAVCALVVVDKQMGKLNDIQEREKYTKVVDLICKFKVDSYEIQPVHYHFVPQEKLMSEYESQFIWLFYTPLIEFDIPWHNSNHFGMTLETSSSDDLFSVQHCGLHLIRQEERKNIDKMIMDSIVLPSTSGGI